MRLIPALLLTTCLMLPLAYTAHAEEKAQEKPAAEDVAKPAAEATENSDEAHSEASHPPIPAPRKIMPVKIKPLQGNVDDMAKAAPTNANAGDNGVVHEANGFGLLVSADDGAFPENMWQGVSASDAAKQLSALPVEFHSYQQRQLLLRAMLTTALAPENSQAEDLLGLRLKNLVEAGALSEAAQLFDKLQTDPQTPLLATYGMMAATHQNTSATSCLDEKAVDEALKNTETNFWRDLKTACDNLLLSAASETPSNTSAPKSTNINLFKDLNADYKEAVEINALSPLKLKAAVEQNKLSPLKQWGLAEWQKLDALHLSVIMNSGLTPLNAHIAAYDKGINNYAQFIKAARPLAIQADALFAKTAETKGDALTDAVKAMLGHVMSSGTPQLLLPFSAEVLNANADAFSAPEAAYIVKALSAVPELAQSAKSAPFVTRALKDSDDKTQTGESNTENLDEGEKAVNYPLLSERILNISENTSKYLKADKNNVESQGIAAFTLVLGQTLSPEKIGKISKKSTYENILNLTRQSDYVMPSDDLLKKLDEAAKSGNAGQAVLLSLEVMAGNKADAVHPAALLKVLKALRNVGLTEEARVLAVEALPALLNIKKEK